MAAAQKELANVECYLNTKENVEGGWVSLHAARRHAILGLEEKELAIQASILRAEASKFTSWRSTEMLNLLKPIADLPTTGVQAEQCDAGRSNLLLVNAKEPTAHHIIAAMALRDEYFSNQYHKIWLTGDQLFLLIVSCVLGLFLLAPLVISSSRHPNTILPSWGYQMVAAVIFFGLLGAAFSAAGSLMNKGKPGNIPERVSNQFVTSARALFGSASGLAGYAFYQSKLLNIHIGDDGGTASGLAIAFLFGFGGELLIAHVLGTLAPRPHD